MTATDLLIHRPDVGFPLFIEEEHPVTFQYSQKVCPGTFVVASDTQCSVAEWRYESIYDPNVKTTEHRSKVSMCEKHQILVAHAGEVPQVGGNRSRELATYLSDSVPDVTDPEQLKRLLEDWGRKSRSGDKFLLVSPKTQREQLFKLSLPSRDRADCVARENLSHFVSGDERNAAVFWPQFFGIGVEQYDLRESIAIAATTIVMAHRLDNRYIGGLEICYYCNDVWTFRNYDDQCKPLWNHLRKTACDQIKNLLLNSDHINQFVSSSAIDQT
jgi:hypothetical protein